MGDRYYSANKKVLDGLKKFPQNVQKNIMNGSTRAAAVVIQKEARALVPTETGNLKKSIVVRKRRARKNTKTVYSVAITYKRQKENKEDIKNDGYYGVFVEYGTKFIAARPFMRPAFNRKWRSTVKVAREYIAKRVEREALKIKRG